MSLHPPQPRIPPTPPPVECEVCGKIVEDADKYSFIVTFANTGHPLPALQCPALQHFGCCPEHALSALMQCLQEHLLPAHQNMQNNLTAENL